MELDIIEIYVLLY